MVIRAIPFEILGEEPKIKEKHADWDREISPLPRQDLKWNCAKESS